MAGWGVQIICLGENPHEQDGTGNGHGHAHDHGRFYLETKEPQDGQCQQGCSGAFEECAWQGSCFDGHEFMEFEVEAHAEHEEDDADFC